MDGRSFVESVPIPCHLAVSLFFSLRWAWERELNHNLIWKYLLMRPKDGSWCV